MFHPISVREFTIHALNGMAGSRLIEISHVLPSFFSL